MYPFAKTPNLRHLRMVQMIGLVGGVSGASREMCTSQPTVTHALSNVELELGTPIFRRCATGTYPTAAGTQFLLRVDRFFDILDNAFAQLQLKTGSGQDRGKPRADRLLTGTQLRSLIVTSEPGHLDELAQGLGLSASTVLRSARALERTLGKPLFDRTARGLIPNKTGEFLANEFRRAVREIELAHGELSLSRGTESLEIVVGGLPMAGAFELAVATDQFMRSNPSVKVRLSIGEYDKMLLDLMNSKIDMFFGMLRRPETTNAIHEEPLFQDSYCLVARPGHPLSRIENLTPEHLTQFQWVVPPQGTPRRTRIEAIFKDCSSHPRFMLETSFLSMSRALLLKSDTITLMTRSEVQTDLDLGVLRDLHCPHLSDVLFKGITTRRDWLPTQAHQDFMDCLRLATQQQQHQPR